MSSAVIALSAVGIILLSSTGLTASADTYFGMLTDKTYSISIKATDNLNADGSLKKTTLETLADGNTVTYADNTKDITVNSGDAWGSQTNPYVISEYTQWVELVKLVNNAETATSGASKTNTGTTVSGAVAYNKAYYYISQNLKFENETVTPLGSYASPFYGTIYGGNHSFTNANFQFIDNGDNTYDVGLFGYVVGTFDSLGNRTGGTVSGIAVYDCTYIQMTQEQRDKNDGLTDSSAASSVTKIKTYTGGIIARAEYPQVINCSATSDYIITDNCTHKQAARVSIGGIVGDSYVGEFYQCTYRGKFEIKMCADTATAIQGTNGKETINNNDNNVRVGGIVGNVSFALQGPITKANITAGTGVAAPDTVTHLLDIYLCNVTMYVYIAYGGPNGGGVFGGWTSDLNGTNITIGTTTYDCLSPNTHLVLKLRHCVVNYNHSFQQCDSPDFGSICGYGTPRNFYGNRKTTDIYDTTTNVTWGEKGIATSDEWKEDDPADSWIEGLYLFGPTSGQLNPQVGAFCTNISGYEHNCIAGSIYSVDDITGYETIISVIGGNTVSQELAAGEVVKAANADSVVKSNVVVTADGAQIISEPGTSYQVTYHLTLNASGGTLDNNKETYDYVFTNALNIYNPTRSGYTFLGWKKDLTLAAFDYAAGADDIKNGYITIPAYNNKGDFTLYAVWSYTPFANGSPSVMASAESVTYGYSSSITLTQTTSYTDTSGDNTYSYQWYKTATGGNESAISGATGATYTISTGENAGVYTYRVEVTGTPASGYTAVTQSASVTVTVKKKGLVITAKACSAEYGTSADDIKSTISWEATGFVGSESQTTVFGSNKPTFDISGYTQNATAAGSTVTIVPSFSNFTLTNYSLVSTATNTEEATTYTNGTLTITQATITVTPQGNSICFGDAAATGGEITLKGSGSETATLNADGTIKSNSDILNLTGSVTFSFVGSSGNAYKQADKTYGGAGSYTIKADVSGLSSTNYKFEAKTATLTVNAKALSAVTVTNDVPDGGYKYDAKEHTPTITAKIGEVYTLVPDTDYTVSYTNSNGKTEKTTTYAGTVTVTLTAKDTTNFSGDTSFTYVINKAELTVTPVAKSVTYYDNLTDDGKLASNEYTLSGFVDAENSLNDKKASEITTSDLLDFAGKDGVTYTTDYTAGNDVGTSVYIRPDVTELSSLNYTFKGADGTLTIQKAEATLTAKNATITYGDAIADGGYGFTVTGVHDQSYDSETGNGTITGFSGTPTYTYTYTADATNGYSNAGTYTITPVLNDGVTSTNYTFKVASGTLTVGKATPTLTGSSNIDGSEAIVGMTIEYSVVKADGTATFMLGGTEHTLTGTWAWETPSTQITNSANGTTATFTADVTFTPTDADATNYEGGKTTATIINIKQLTITPVTVSLGYETNGYYKYTKSADTSTSYAFDWNTGISVSRATLANGNPSGDVTFTMTRNGTTATESFTYALDSGYETVYYFNYTSDGAYQTRLYPFSGEVTESASNSLTESKNVYIVYSEIEVTYTVYRNLQQANGEYYSIDYMKNNTGLASNGTFNIETCKALTHSTVTASSTAFANGAAITDNELQLQYFTYDASSTASVVVTGDGTSYIELRYKRNGYSAIWNANGGYLAIGTKPTTFNYGQQITFNYSNPTRSGYSFKGWNTDKTAKQAENLPAMGTSNITFYAVWEAKKYSIIFDYTSLNTADLNTAQQTIGSVIGSEAVQNLISAGMVWEDMAATGRYYEPVNGTIALSSKKPTFPGMTFVRWVYYKTASDGTQSTTPTYINNLTDDVLSLAYSTLNADSVPEITIYAEWAVGVYTHTFNNNGVTLSNRVSVTNFAYYDDLSTEAVDGFATQFPSGLTRNGYEFIGWFTEELPSSLDFTSNGYTGYRIAGTSTVAFDNLNDRDTVALTGDAVLYAGWKPVDYSIAFDVPADSSSSPTASLTVKINGAAAVDYYNAKAHVGDRIELVVTPLSGYRLKTLQVDGSNCSSGLYSVSYGYENNEIAVAATTEEITYMITYTSLGGGSWAEGASNVASTFSASAINNGGVALPDGKAVVRTGYGFVGWRNAADENADPVTTLNESFFGSSGLSNVQLVAVWKAEVQTIRIYVNDKNLTPTGWPCGTDWDNPTAYPDSEQEFVTGATVKLMIPLPTNTNLIGFSLTSSGNIVYTAQSPESVENGNVQYVYYTVKGGDNELYCHWIGSDELFVQINTSEADYTYNPDKSLTLTASLLQGYTDTSVTAVVYEFTWKKYNEKTTQWDTVKTETINLTSSNENPKSTLTLKNINDNGKYRCELVTTVTSILSDGTVEVRKDYAVNTSNTLGVVYPFNADWDREVTINKATVTGLSMLPVNVEYNGSNQTSQIKVLSNAGSVSADGLTLTLPDGTTASIKYTFVKDGDTVALTQVTDAGIYSVKAEFVMPANSNYADIPSIEALLTVEQKAITSVTFYSNNTPNSSFEREYKVDENGNPVALKITAVPGGIVSGDDVTIVLQNGSATDIGTYYAIVSGLDGAKSGNYVLSLDATASQKQYQIRSATRTELNGLDFADIDGGRELEITYDGEEHTFGLDANFISQLSDEAKENVKWTYVVTYTAEYGDYQSTGNNTISVEADGVHATAAGVYVITAVFTDANVNYGAKASLTATFKILPADYLTANGIKMDACDGNGENNEGEGDNFTDNQSIVYDVDSTVYHKPVITSDKLTADVEAGKLSVEYVYALFNRETGDWYEFEIGEGFKAVGEYRITAKITLLDGAYANNYARIDDIVINYSIVLGDIERLELRDANGDIVDGGVALTGIFNGELDRNQFMLYVVYQDNKGTEQVPDGSYYIVDNELASSGEGISVAAYNLLDKFIKAKTDYSITFWYSTGSLPYTVNVSPAEYAFDQIAITNESEGTVTETYSADGFAPEVSFVATDVDGNEVDGISIVYKVDGEWLTAETVRTALKNVGTYSVTLGYVHSDGNYVGTTETAFKAENGTGELTYTVEITAQPVDEVVWQYNATDNDDDWQDLTADQDGNYKLPYIGKAYSFRALYKGDGDNEQIATVSAGEGVTVLNAANNYSLTATSQDSNYKIAVDALTLEVTPKEVELGWFVGEAEYDATKKQLTYSGSDLFGSISVKYTDVDGSEVANGTDDDAKLKITVQTMINAGDYTLTVTNADGNYTLTTATLTVTVYGTEISSATFQYKDADRQWKSIPEGGLPYKGEAYEFRAVYYTSEGSTEQTATATSAAGEVKNAGEYTLTVGNNENYFISATCTVTINKVALTVSYQSPTYNGEVQSLGIASVSGLVGGDANAQPKEVVELGGTSSAKDVGESSYLATASLLSPYGTNYYLAESSYYWNITPFTVSLTWTDSESGGTTYTYTYNTTKQRPTATVKDLPEVDKAHVSLAYSGAASDAGNYTATVTQIYYDGNQTLNYKLDSATSSQTFTITKATVTLNNFKYKEYEIENTTYNGTPLRNDKLTADAYIMVNGNSISVSGSLEFDPASINGLDAGIKSVTFYFKPKDTTNYAESEYTITLTVQTLKPSALELDVSGAKTSYVKDDSLNTAGIVAYVTYNNYYVDELTGTPYGKKEEYSGTVSYWLDDSQTITFTEAGTYQIKATTSYNSINLVGYYDVTVASKSVTQVTLNQNDKTVYYVGEKFDVTQIALNVLYEGESVPVKETENITLVEPTGAFSAENAAQSVTVSFGGVKCTFTVEVRNKEDLVVAFTGRQLQYENGTAIAIPTATYNGQPLYNNVAVDGIIATYEIMNENVYQIVDKGDYIIKVSFTITNPRYNPHDSITATFSVVDEVKLSELTLLSSSKLEIETESEVRYLVNVAAGATVAEVLGQFEETGGTITVTNVSGKEISGGTLIGTGGTITLYDANGSEVDSVTVVIKGDLNGDGNITNMDKVYLNYFMSGKMTAEGAAKLAADINGDNNITNMDKVYLNYHLAGKMDIFAMDISA